MTIKNAELKRCIKMLGTGIYKWDTFSIVADANGDTFSAIMHSKLKGDTILEKSVNISIDGTYNEGITIPFIELKRFSAALSVDADITIVKIDNKKVKLISNISLVVDNIDYDDDVILTQSPVEVIYNNEIIVPEAVYHAIDYNNPKVEVNGLMLHFMDGNMVSTDTRRLAIKQIEKVEHDSIIIPRFAIIPDKKILKIGIIDFNYVTLFYEDIIVTSRLINGKYPDYRRVIPQDIVGDIKFNANSVKQFLKKSKCLDIRITFSIGNMRISSINENGIQAESNFVCSYNSDTDFSFAVNSRYIIDAIVSNDSELLMRSDGLPFILKSGDINTVIMPILTTPINRSDESHSVPIPNVSSEHFKYDSVEPPKKSRQVKTKVSDVEKRLAEALIIIQSLKDEIEVLSKNDASAPNNELDIHIDRLKRRADSVKDFLFIKNGVELDYDDYFRVSKDKTRQTMFGVMDNGQDIYEIISQIKTSKQYAKYKKKCIAYNKSTHKVKGA